jgi:large subunit ribosomal protein L19
MKQCKEIQILEAEQLKSDVPMFNIGDVICIHQRITEGDKERIQQFSGTVIARKGGGLSETVSLYRFSYGAGIERVFMLHSPKIAKIELVRSGKVRKSKLYHIRGTSGKAAKIEERIVKTTDATESS